MAPGVLGPCHELVVETVDGWITVSPPDSFFFEINLENFKSS